MPLLPTRAVIIYISFRWGGGRVCYVWRHASLPPPPPPPPPPRSVMARVTHQQFVYIRSRICRLLGTGMDFPHAVGASKNNSLKYRNIPNLPPIILYQTLRFFVLNFVFPSSSTHSFAVKNPFRHRAAAAAASPKNRWKPRKKEIRIAAVESSSKKRYFVSNTSDVK